MFVVSALAVWRLSAIGVPVNPMLRPDELTPMLSDSGARTMIAHPAMRDVVETAAARLPSPLSCWWSAPAELAGDMPRPFDGAEAGASGTASGDRVLLDAASQIDPDEDVATAPAPSDVALLTYTSGTTGPSKGAMSTHANLAFQVASYGQWFELGTDSSVLTVAPLFHITGLGAHLAAALGGGHPLVMTYRFEPAAVLRLIETYHPTFTIGAITAFISLLDAAPDSGATVGLMTTLYSGGAPVPAQVVERFESATGTYLHNMYGLTETTSACIGVPLGLSAPIDPGSGALSIGIPMGGTSVKIVDDDGQLVAAGAQGEIVVAGPQVCSGYWHKPEESALAFRADGVHTGDIGVMDDAGWIYVVDRKKDLVVVSGYKVWPRDVEDVIYRHPAIKEVAVVGKPDDYRGETLHAFYSLRAGQTLQDGELRAFCKEHLSAYKVPTRYIEVSDLPKTPTGKILRRSLRD
ncbi:MAG: AMP-binding protein [Candidatus Saccharibacteria bacterium]|nr:AMP-binding protein [Microbacteriaceae bacterium]